MMTLQATLVCEQCMVSGELGLRDIRQSPKEHVYLDTGTGTLLAHDYVEHINGINAIGTIEDELEALGAVWAIRGNYSNDIDHYGLASDLVNNYGYYFERKRFNPPPNTEPHPLDADFMEILSQAEKLADSEFYGEPGHTTNAWDYFKHLALAGMRTGVRKLHAKYQSTWPESQAYDNFQAIVRAVSGTPLEEGWIYQLNLDGSHCTLLRDEL